MKKFKAFLALDCKEKSQNLKLIKTLSSKVFGFKVGYRAFYSDGHKEIIAEIKKRKSIIFLDLKLHDIPNTVNSAIEALSNINPDYLTIHISGGKIMLDQALATVKKNKLNTKLLGVTLLTSLDKKDSKLIYAEKDTNILVKKLAKIANKTNIHGLICSGKDLVELKQFKKLIKITPGVKMFKRKDDQKRISYVHDAINDGADFVVIGRELINHKNPVYLLEEYYERNKNKDLWTN